MSTENIQQTPKKISKSSTTANISFESVVAGFANQLETYLARRTFMQTGIAHCSLLLRTYIYGRPLRQDKLLSPLLCRPSERNLKNFISFKTVISDLSLQGGGKMRDPVRTRLAFFRFLSPCFFIFFALSPNLLNVWKRLCAAKVLVSCHHYA